jgi:site-specific DNA-methyltransferase (adenine-specific)
MTSKVYEGRARIELIHGDCMEGMSGMQDNQFDLAIVDPEYFSGPEKKKYYGQKISSKGVRRVKYHTPEKWSVPDPEYFDELMRVCNNQIIWGVNYFNNFSFGPGRIVWDKINQSTTYSDCELAYCSFHDSVRMIRYMWNGMCQGKSLTDGHLQQGNKKLNEKRIHQCQKPVLLYKWQLGKYAECGNSILDTHGGSMSLAIACWDLGFDLTCYEIDKEYYYAAVERFENHIKQEQLFEPSDFHTNNNQKTLYK